MKYLLLTLTLLTFTAAAQNKVVIGQDTRVRISSENKRDIHDSIGLLEMPHGFCTGTVISPRHVITSAHCLVDEGKLISFIHFTPGLNGDVNNAKRPFGTFKGRRIRIIKNYLSDEKTKHDLGLITFAENLPVTPLSIAVGSANDVYLTIAGYPGDKQMGTLWEGKGKRSNSFFSAFRKTHNVDTFSGQSGSAIRANVFGKEKIIGIHSGGVGAIIINFNLGTFIDVKQYRLINKWIAEDN